LRSGRSAAVSVVIIVGSNLGTLTGCHA